MSQPEIEFTVAQQIDPGFGCITPDQSTLNYFDAPRVKSNITKGVIGAVAALTSLGVTSQEAYADHPCLPGEYDVVGGITRQIGVDEVGNPIYELIDICADDPAPQPTSPPTTRPSSPPTSGGSSGGSGGGSVSVSTAPSTAIDLDLDNDGFVRDQGFLPDVDDNSPGLGEQGAIDARALGIDVDSGSEEANRNLLIAYTVSPDNWNQTIANFALYGVSVMVPTTSTPTTTEAPTTTTTIEEAEIVDTTLSEESVDTTLENDTTTTEVEVAVITDTENNDDDSNTLIWYSLGGVVGGAALFGLVAFSRRRQRSDQPLTA